MSTNNSEQDGKANADTASGAALTTPGKPLSERKIQANQQNAQRSTGPKTPEGKARSSQNAVSHGIFAKQFLRGAAPETVEEITALAAGIREHYQPVGMLEKLLVEKIVVESGRYGRILSIEQQELARDYAFFNAAIDRVGRYASSTSRALFRAIEELERLQAARKAQATAAANADDPAPATGPETAGDSAAGHAN